MANFRSALVQGGLGLQAAQDYDEQQAQRTYAQRAREYGVRVMGSEERRREAADTLLDTDTAIKRLRADIAQNELAFQQQTQPAEQGMRRSEIEHRARLQPGAQRLETIQQGTNTRQVQAQGRLLPGQEAIAAETQNMQTQTLREQQAGNLWALLSVGDKQGTLDLINKSTILHPGRKFSDIQRGAVPVRGNDGQPLVENGKPVTEEMLRMVAADGGEDVFVSVKRLEANAAKHGTRYEKVGSNLVRISREGAVSGVYEPEQYAVNPETGEPYSRRTGLPPVAAAGINPPGGAGAAAPGAPRAPGARPPRKAEAHVDARVKQLDSEIRFYLTGSYSLAVWDPETQKTYNKLMAIGGQLVRSGMAPEEARKEAIDQVRREEAALAAGGRRGGGAAYSGPTPWRR